MPEETTSPQAAPTPAPAATPDVPTSPSAPKPIQQTPPQAELKADPNRDLDQFFAEIHNEKPKEEKPTEAPKQPEAKEPETPPEDEEVSKFTTAKNLREAYTKLKKQLAEREKEFEAFKARPAPEDPEKPKLLETLSAREQRLKELEEKVKFYDYTNSDEYRNTYDKPFKDAWAYATQAATGLVVKVEGGTPRNVTDKEFAAIVNTTSDNDALEAAHALFEGDKLGAAKAARLMEQRERILTQFRAAENAKSEWARTVEAREKETAAKQVAERL